MSRSKLSDWRELRAALRNREWRALYLAALLSQFGDQLARFVIALVIYARTGSAAQSALAFAVSYLPYLIGAGVTGLGDRYPRHRVMIISDLVRAVLAALLAIHGLGTVALLLLFFCVGLAEPPFEAARAALAADLLDPDAYTGGHALQMSSLAVVSALGALFAGVLVGATGATAALLVNAGTFVVSAVLIASRVNPRPAPPSQVANPTVGAGFGVVWSSPSLRTYLFLAASCAALTVPVDALAVVIASRNGRGAVWASVLLAAPLLGTAVSNLLVTRLNPDTRLGLLAPIACLSAAPVALFVFQPGMYLAVVLALLTGLFQGYQILANQGFVLSVANEDRSKAFGAASATLMAGQGIASALAGVLAEYVEPERLVGLSGLLALACVWIASHMLRSIRPSASVAMAHA